MTTPSRTLTADSRRFKWLLSTLEYMDFCSCHEVMDDEQSVEEFLASDGLDSWRAAIDAAMLRAAVAHIEARATEGATVRETQESSDA